MIVSKAPAGFSTSHVDLSLPCILLSGMHAMVSTAASSLCSMVSIVGMLMLRFRKNATGEKLQKDVITAVD